MHELSVGRALLRQIESIVMQQQAVSVTRITLRVGPLSGIEPALLRTAYEQLRTDTVAANAALRIIGTPVCVRCGECGTVGDAECNQLACPWCGSNQTVLVSGDEMLIESVDLTFEDE